MPNKKAANHHGDLQDQADADVQAPAQSLKARLSSLDASIVSEVMNEAQEERKSEVAKKRGRKKLKVVPSAKNKKSKAAENNKGKASTGAKDNEGIIAMPPNPFAKSNLKGKQSTSGKPPGALMFNMPTQRNLAHPVNNSSSAKQESKPSTNASGMTPQQIAMALGSHTQ